MQENVGKVSLKNRPLEVWQALHSFDGLFSTRKTQKTNTLTSHPEKLFQAWALPQLYLRMTFLPPWQCLVLLRRDGKDPSTSDSFPITFPRHKCVKHTVVGSARQKNQKPSQISHFLLWGRKLRKVTQVTQLGHEIEWKEKLKGQKSTTKNEGSELTR